MYQTLFLLLAICMARPSLAYAYSFSYWQKIDAQYGEAKKDLLSSKEAKEKVETLSRSTDVEEHALSLIIKRAQADTSFARRLQKLIRSVRAHFAARYKYPFIIDGNFSHRSISELIRLYKDAAERAELKKALADIQLPLNETTSKSLERETISATTALSALAAINKKTRVDSNCADSISDPGDRYISTSNSSDSKSDIWSPAQAIEAAASEPLQPLSKSVLAGSDTLKSCIFQNSKVYVVYNYCTKSEAPATSISIYSIGGGAIHFYIENSAKQSGAISGLNRRQYDESWRIGYSATESIPAKTSPQQIVDYINAQQAGIASKNFCSTGGIQGSDQKLSPTCEGSLSEKLPAWSELSQDFWNHPPPFWYDFLKQMRANAVKF